MNKPGKKVRYKKQGNKISIKIYDDSWNVIYSKEHIGIKDKKGIRELLKDLKNLGFDFKKIFTETGTGWFD